MCKKILVLSLTFFCAFGIAAQEIYYAEIGVNGGFSNYFADVNKGALSDQSLSYGLIYRQKFNTRTAIQANWNMTKITSTEFSEINNRINLIDICGEFNFFDLEKRVYKPFSRDYSPFIFAGPVMVLYDYETKPQFDLGVTVGVGMKVLIGKQVNLNAMLAYRVLGTDKLEGLSAYNNPTTLNGSNPFNKDMLWTFTVGITFNFWKSNCDCHY